MGIGRCVDADSDVGLAPAPVHVQLLGFFEVHAGDGPVELPLDAQRLLVFLALRRGPVPRPHVAGVLWTDSSEERAFASLRSALWRIRSRVGYALIDSTKHYVRLTPAVSVDFDEAAELADRLRSQSAAVPLDADWTPLAADLLPGWYDDWILFERERFKNAALEALEALAERLLTEGRFGHALDAALAAVAKDPFRESPQRVVMKAHVAGGNVATAARAYRSYARLLRDELGLDPSPQMQALAAECRIT